MIEPIIGTGPEGHPVTARQTFLHVLDEIDREWKFQEELTEEDLNRLSKEFGFHGAHGAHDYLNARLEGSLKTLYLVAKKLPKAMFTMQLPES